MPTTAPPRKAVSNLGVISTTPFTFIKMYLLGELAEKSLPKGCVKGVWFKLRFTPRFDFEIA